MVTSLLDKAKSKIEEAYISLHHNQDQHGWSFLYTTSSTLSPEARFLFMGLNPGGEGKADDISVSSERGNAYNHTTGEDWGKGPGVATPLQLQVEMLYKLLAEKLEKNEYSYPGLMDATLAANFCPFRSKDWAGLKNKDETIRFCKELWKDIILQTSISTVITMSRVAYQHLSDIIVESGGQQLDESDEGGEVGWGKIKYYVSRFNLDGRDILIVNIPHLSRYRIFGRPESDKAVNKIISLVAESLGGWPDPKA